MSVFELSWMVNWIVRMIRPYSWSTDLISILAKSAARKNMACIQRIGTKTFLYWWNRLFRTMHKYIADYSHCLFFYHHTYTWDCLIINWQVVYLSDGRTPAYYKPTPCEANAGTVLRVLSVKPCYQPSNKVTTSFPIIQILYIWSQQFY